MINPLFVTHLLVSMGSVGENSGTGDAGDWRGKGSGVFADSAITAVNLGRLAGGVYLKAGNPTFKQISRVKRPLKWANLPVIQSGLNIIIALEQLNGFGWPEKGAKLNALFAPIHDTLAAAKPNNSWEGSGSKAYSSANMIQVTNAQTMVDADVSLHAILKREAVQVEDTRLVLASMKNFLVFICIPTAIALKVYASEHASTIFQYSVVTAAVTASVAAQATMVNRSFDNASQVRAVISRYREVRADAKPTDTPFALSTGGGRTLGPNISGSGGPGAAVGGDRAADDSPGQPSPMQLRSSTTDLPGTTAQTPIDNHGEDLSEATTLDSQVQQGPPARWDHVGQQTDLSSARAQVGARKTQGRPQARFLGQDLDTIEDNAAGAASGSDDAGRAPVESAMVHSERLARGRTD